MMMSGGIHEPEIDRLQKQSDVFTKKYEHERKQILGLKEKLDNLLREKEKIEKDMIENQQIKPEKKKEQAQEHPGRLENILEKKVIKYD